MKTFTFLFSLIFSLFTFYSCSVLADSSSRSPATVVADAAVTTYVRAKLALDKNFSHYEIKVSTNNHIVDLSGMVNDPVEIKGIADMVSDTAGVRKVDATKITLRKDEQKFADAIITTKIFFNLVKAKWMNKQDIAFSTLHVNTKNGIVYLTGTAENSDQLQNALQAADEVKGVLRISSFVQIGKFSDEKKCLDNKRL